MFSTVVTSCLLSSRWWSSTPAGLGAKLEPALRKVCWQAIPASRSRANEFTTVLFKIFWSNIIYAPAGDQRQHSRPVELQLPGADPGDSGQLAGGGRAAFGQRGQRRVREHHVGGPLLPPRRPQPPLPQPFEQLLVQRGRAGGAAAELAVRAGQQGRAAHPARHVHEAAAFAPGTARRLARRRSAAVQGGQETAR